MLSCQRSCEQADADRVHARRPVIGPDPLPRLHEEALIDLKRLHLGPGPGPGLLPLRVGHGLTLVCTAPSLQPHYRTFTATTGRPAPVPRLGTLPLAVSAARGPPSRGQARAAPVTRPPLSGRQVLLFHASACDELTPPLHRAPPGQQAGSPLAEGTPPRRAFVPGVLRSPGFDAIVPPIDASAVVHARSSSRRTPDPLTAGLFLQRSPPRLLTGAACSGLGSPPARRTRRTYLHHWHSTVHSATFYIASLPFRTHRRTADIARRISAGPRPSVTQAGAATAPSRTRRRCPAGGHASNGCSARVSSGARDPSRNPQGSQHRSFGMMKDRNLVGTVSFGAARTGCGRGRPRPGSA